MGADTQVGMALYSGQLTVSQAFSAPLESDRAVGLWPTVVVVRADALQIEAPVADSIRSTVSVASTLAVRVPERSVLEMLKFGRMSDTSIEPTRIVRAS